MERTPVSLTRRIIQQLNNDPHDNAGDGDGGGNGDADDPLHGTHLCAESFYLGVEPGLKCSEIRLGRQVRDLPCEVSDAFAFGSDLSRH